MNKLNSDAYIKIKEVAEFSLNLKDQAEQYIIFKERDGYVSSIEIKNDIIYIYSKKMIKYIYEEPESEKQQKIIDAELERKRIEHDIKLYAAKKKNKKHNELQKMKLKNEYKNEDDYLHELRKRRELMINNINK